MTSQSISGVSDIAPGIGERNPDMIKHTGHGCPVARDVIVTVTLRNGNVRSGHRADYWDWWHSDHPADVMLYQVEPRP